MPLNKIPPTTKRITITVANHVYDKLGRVSFDQGRSMSNLCAFVLEDFIRRHSDT